MAGDRLRYFDALGSLTATALPRQARVRLSALGFGAAQIGNLYRVTSDTDVQESVDTAWEAGIRYFDTAPHYGLGLSERRLGEALRERPREEFVLSTKVGRILVDSPETATEQDTQGFAVPASLRRELDYTRDGVLRSIEDSLERIGTDYIDVAYIHDPDEHYDDASTGAVKALTELRDQGVIRAWGAGMNQSAMLTRFVREHGADVVMCAGRYTLLEQPALTDLLPAAAETGAGVVIAGVYNSGLLARDHVAPDATYNYEAAPADLVERARAISQVCGEHGVTLPQAALAFVLGHPAVVSTVVGLRTRSQVQDTVERATAPVPDALWAELKAHGLLAQDAPTPTTI